MNPLLLLKLAWKFRKWIGIAIAVIAVAIMLHRVNVWHTKAGKLDGAVKALATEQKARAADRAAWQSQVDTYTARLAAQEADTAALNGKLTDAATVTQTLQKALQRARLVTHEPNPVAGQPDVVRLSSGLRTCLNASATRSAAEIASCEAFGVRDPAIAQPANPR